MEIIVQNYFSESKTRSNPKSWYSDPDQIRDKLLGIQDWSNQIFYL